MFFPDNGTLISVEPRRRRSIFHMTQAAFPDAWTEALAVQHAAANVGFDWPEISGVLEKIAEELDEIRGAVSRNTPEEARRELGDLLFAAVNLARFLHADPAAELRRATSRFSQRFSLLKQELARQGRAINDCNLEELDVVWEKVKNS